MTELTETMAKFVEEGAGHKDIQIMSLDTTGAFVLIC